MSKRSLGVLELQVLRYITDHAPLSVGEVAGQYGDAHGLARTTILTVMERLRKKGYLTRTMEQGVYQYSPSVSKALLLRELIGNFMEDTLGGSLGPFVAYLAEGASVSDDELRELKDLVRTLDQRRKQGEDE